MKTILIVDDSQVVRQQLRLVLQGAGYNVVEASDGQQALGVLASRNIELIITDVNMPHMNGLELLERLDLRARDTPSLVLTVEHHPTLSDRARRAGARGWIIKPFKAEQLVKAVNKLLGGAASVQAQARDADH